MPVGTLFSDDFNDAQPNSDDNAADAAALGALGALLTALHQATAVVVLADALRWDTERVPIAAATLTALLQTTGTTVFKNDGHMSIRLIGDSHSDAELRARRHPRDIAPLKRIGILNDTGNTISAIDDVMRSLYPEVTRN